MQTGIDITECCGCCVRAVPWGTVREGWDTHSRTHTVRGADESLAANQYIARPVVVTMDFGLAGQFLLIGFHLLN